MDNLEKLPYGRGLCKKGDVGRISLNKCYRFQVFFKNLWLAAGTIDITSRHFSKSGAPLLEVLMKV